MTGIARNVSGKINDLLEQFPAVAILGVRQAGKTTLSRHLHPKWRYVDLENPDDYQRIAYDPVFFFKNNPTDVILDEAQGYPELFQVLRGVIDADRTRKGRFLITGSSNPTLLKHIAESLAGRIAIVELGPLKANEIYSQQLSPIYRLFEKRLKRENLIEGRGTLTLEQVRSAWLWGGYPEPVLNSDPGYRAQWMEQYRLTYINRDLADLFPRLNRQNYQRFLSMLARLSGSIINKRDISRALEVSEGTIRHYLTIAEGIYLWRNLPSFEHNVLKAVIKMPKGHLRDTGLMHFLLNLHNEEALHGDPAVGASFESYVIEEIIRGLQAVRATNWQAHYYRTRNGAEVDLVLDGPFGLLPIEINYGSRFDSRRLRALSGFIADHHLEFGLLINQAEESGWITENIFQLSATWL